MCCSDEYDNTSGTTQQEAKTGLKETYNAYFKTNKEATELFFTEEKDGRTMGYLKRYDAEKRQRQVNPKGKVKCVNRNDS